MLRRIAQAINTILGRSSNKNRSPENKARAIVARKPKPKASSTGVHRKGHFDKQRVWPLVDERHKGPKI